MPCIVATPDMRGILGSDDGEGEHRGSQAVLSAGPDASAGANQVDTARQALPYVVVVHPQRCSPSKSFVRRGAPSFFCPYSQAISCMHVDK